MDFEVYCDESYPELLTSSVTTPKYTLIGSLWLLAELREDIKKKIIRLREEYGVWGELKWRKISSSKLQFYLELIDLFFSYGHDLRFRCIQIEKSSVNMEMIQNDAELGFYKFYYQVIHHWILDFNKYFIFCDRKSNKVNGRLSVMHACLTNANRTSVIKQVQHLPSKESVLLQFCDVLLGAASARLNNAVAPNSAKEKIILRLESRLNLSGTIAPTSAAEKKFNVFKIRLEGGW